MTGRLLARQTALRVQIESLYDAAGDEAAFGEALGALRPLFGAAGVIYILPWHDSGKDGAGRKTRQSSHVAAHGISEDALADYHSHFFAYDEWRLAVLRAGSFVPGFIARGGDLVPFERLKRTYFWREFLVPHGTRDILTAVIAASQNELAFVTFHRSMDDRAGFDAGSMTMLASLVPHLARALRLHQRIAPQLALGKTLTQIFDDMTMPMLFLTALGRVAAANRPSRATLDEAKLLRVGPGDRLQVHAERGWTKSEDVLRPLEQSPSSDVIAIGADGDAPMQLSLRRVHGVLDERLSASEVFAVATVRPFNAGGLALLGHHYHLTPAEVRVVRCLLEGSKPARIAVELGVGVGTVRTHLSNLFAKTGTSCQSELVARLKR